MQQTLRRKAVSGCFHFRTRNQESTFGRLKKVSRSWMESEKSIGFESGNVKKGSFDIVSRSNAQHINWAMQSEESEVNQGC